MGVDFSPEALLDQARTSTGLGDFGSDHFRDYLGAWCDDLASPRLSETGRASLARLAVRNLETRLRITDTLRQHPEILDVPLPGIVRIVGLPRSGTTLFHQLLSLGADRRALLRWELVAPLPPPEVSTYYTDPRIEKVGRPLDALRGTDLERMHWVEATDPEECTWGFFDLTGLLGRGVIGVMPSWGELLFATELDHRATYLDYRHLVQLLLWRNPLPAGGTLVLKCPTDVDQLPAFLDVFPEAAVVQLHRDPFRTLTSQCRIGQIINQGYLDAASPLTDEELVEFAFFTHIKQTDAMVDVTTSHSSAVTNVHYADLMADPAATIAAVEERIGMSRPAVDTGHVVSQFLEQQRAGTRAAPPADYGTFGVTPAIVRGEPSLARYISTFEIPAEHNRLTAPQ